MERKYELMDETIICDGRTLHRIRAVRDFADVKAGNLGGWIEKECNLDQDGDFWVYGDAKVYGNAKVCGDANIKSMKDYIVFKNWWSSGRWFTWTRSNNMWKVGCFHGTGAELVEKAYKDSEESGRHYKEIVDYVERCVLGKNTDSDESQNQRPRD